MPFLSYPTAFSENTQGQLHDISFHFVGKIRDSIHNNIPFTDAEKNIINSPVLQRLRRIQQMPFTQYIFPGASHTRFEHSLGAMHLAGQLYTSLIMNQGQILSSLKKIYNQSPAPIQEAFQRREKTEGSLLQTEEGLCFLSKSVYLAQCVRFAALLHDCGHPPLSHSGERFLPSWQEFQKNISTLSLPKWLQQALEAKAEKASPEKLVTHETYTLMAVNSLFSQESNNLLLSPQMGQDICAILDNKIPPSCGSDLEISQMQNLLHDIISGEIDVDRMDYLIRDSKECGVVYGIFDVGRILDSFCFYKDLNTNKYNLALRKGGIPAYEDFLRARLSMYYQVYFHKTENACEAMLGQLNEKWGPIKFPYNIDNYLKLNDHNFTNYVEKYSNHSGTELNDFLQNLVYNRCLWKRVYEEVLDDKEKSAKARENAKNVARLLRSKGISCQVVESTTALTRFQKVTNQPQLKTVLKDIHSLGHLSPIKEHSALLKKLEGEFFITRVFVDFNNIDKQKLDTNKIQLLISEALQHA